MWLFSRRPDVARLAERRDINGLAEALQHREPAIRAAAARALGACGQAAATALVAAVGDSEPAVRLAVREALAALPTPSAVAALVERLEAEPEDRAPVLAMLGQFTSHPEVRAVLEARLASGTTAERLVAAQALGRRGDAQAVAPLTQALADPEAVVVEAAQAALVVVGAERALPALTVVLASGSPEVRVAAAQALGAMSDARSLPALAAALADPEPNVRQAALAAIAQAPEPGRQISLLAGTGVDPVERERAAQRLVQIGTVAPLVGALRATDHPGLRAAAARALGRLGGPEAVAALVAAIADPEPAVRLEATWMLGVTGDPAALDPLLTALTQAEDAGVRATAARALGRLGAPAAIPVLEAAQGDMVEAVRTAASRAVATLRSGIGTPVQGPQGSLLQAVLIIPDPSPEERGDYVTRLLDHASADAYAAEAGLHVVTMRAGEAVPSLDTIRLILRQQFRTPPAGYAWLPSEMADEQGRRCVLMQLRQAE